MGDAAHAAGPTQAQGAAQALEDACVVSALFERVRCPAHVPNALLAYDQTRRVRAQRILRTAPEAGQLASMRQRDIWGDLDKMKKALETRMHWIWHRNLAAQNEEAVRLFQESL